MYALTEKSVGTHGRMHVDGERPAASGLENFGEPDYGKKIVCR